jgi:hypothetical protein
MKACLAPAFRPGEVVELQAYQPAQYQKRKSGKGAFLPGAFSDMESVVRKIAHIPPA